MKVLELFSGTKSISKEFKKRGHETFTIDNDTKMAPSMCRNILDIDGPMILEQAIEEFDVIWASPPCPCFSVASIGTHWGGGKGAYEPKTERAKDAIDLVRHTLSIITYLEPKYWFVENPRGVLRKLPIMRNYQRVTITYCQYGDSRMKPTDIWGNWGFNEIRWRPMCKNGDPCHERAPRGAKTGTQGLKNARERGRIPSELGISLCEQLEKLI